MVLVKRREVFHPPHPAPTDVILKWKLEQRQNGMSGNALQYAELNSQSGNHIQSAKTYAWHRVFTEVTFWHSAEYGILHGSDLNYAEFRNNNID